MKSPLLFILLAAGGGVFGAPELSVSPSTFSFGKYPANQEKKHTFTLTNTGDAVLKIEKVRHTCGCSGAEIDKNELQPGETAQLEAKILPESIDGPFCKGIFIHSNAGNGAIRMITLSGQSEALLTVLPQNNCYIGTVKPDAGLTQEFILVARQAVKYGVPEISGDIRPAVIAESLEGHKSRIRLSWTSAGKDSLFKCTVKIPILEPADWKPVELNLQGTVKGDGGKM